MTTQQRDAYLAQARDQQLEAFAERSWALYRRFPFEAAPIQPAPDLVDAYAQAHRLAVEFEQTVAHCAGNLGVFYRMRPGGVKDANRALEKMGGKQKELPLDLLGGTLVCPTIASIYTAADYATTFFEVVSFRDRCVAPVLPSGYRDLQMTVRLQGGHLAELKVLHEITADLDRHEHKLLELQRVLERENLQELSFVNNLVSTTLTEASQRMYTQAWQQVLMLEELISEEGDDDDA